MFSNPQLQIGLARAYREALLAQADWQRKTAVARFGWRACWPGPMGNGRVPSGLLKEYLVLSKISPLVEKVSGLERIVFMSDAVFAIALTLLALEIKLPPLEHPLMPGEFAGAILGLLPKFYSYVLSFLVLGVYWVAHHRDFGSVTRYDARLIWLNLFTLMCVAFLPFSSALLGEYGNFQLTWVIFALNNIAISALLSLAWGHARRKGMVEDREPTGLRYRTYRGLLVPVVFLLSLGVSCFDLTLAQIMPLLLIFTGPVAARLAGHDYP